MKKYIFLLFLVIFSCNCIGQINKYGISLTLGIPCSDPSTINQAPWKGVDFNFEHKSYSAGLLANYNFNDTTAFRFRFGITKFDIRIFQDNYDNKIQYFDTVNYKQTNIHLAPGIIWNVKIRKILLNFGFEIPFNILGKYSMNWNSISTDSLTNNNLYKSQSIETYPKGYSFGTGAILGFTYHLLKHFSVSSEFSPSILYSSVHGTYSRQFKTIFPSNSSSTFPLDYKNKGYFYEQRFFLGFTYWL